MEERVSVKSLLKQHYASAKAKISELAQVKKESKLNFSIQAAEFLKSTHSPISSLPKPHQKVAYYCVKGLPLVTFLQNDGLLKFYNLKSKLVYSKKRKSTYRSFTKYFGRRRSSYRRRSYGRRSSYRRRPTYRRKSYRRSYGRRSYRRRY